MNKLMCSILMALLFSLPAMAQSQEVEMADTMRSNGKIYVVVAIVLVIFLGMIGYLILTDRKISRIEKKLSEKK